MKPEPWDRKLWGVQWDGGTNAPKHPILIGSLWSERTEPGEAPMRALLFCTRRECRAWIASKQSEYWAGRMRPVRVRELVEVL